MLRKIVCIFNLSIVACCGSATIDSSGIVFDSAYSFDASNQFVANGFVWFRQGCVMSVRQAVRLNIVTPISGALNLNNSRFPLTLAHDVTLGSGAALLNSGIIDGNDEYSIVLGSDIRYEGPRLVAKGITFQGNKHTFVLGHSAVIAIPNDFRCVFKDLTLAIMPGARFEMMGDNSRLILSNVHLVLMDNYVFDRGHLVIKRTTVLSSGNNNFFSFASAGNLYIHYDATLSIAPDTSLRYACRGSRNILFCNRSSTIKLIGGMFESINVPVELKKGQLIAFPGSSMRSSGQNAKIIWKFAVTNDSLRIVNEPNMMNGSPQSGVTEARWI